MPQVNGAASRGVCFLYNQRLLMAEHLLLSLPLPARRLANVLVLEPLLALGGRVTTGLLAGIDLLGAVSIAATKATLLVSRGTLLGVAAAAGLGIGVTSLVLSQRMFTDHSNVALLWEDLCSAPGLLWRWLGYGFLSTAYSRMAAGDARVSYGATLTLAKVSLEASCQTTSHKIGFLYPIMFQLQPGSQERQGNAMRSQLI